MTHRRSSVFALCAALAIAIAQPAWGASPKETLQNFFGGANAILQSADPDQGTDAPREAIRVLVNQIFDYQDAAARALGPSWLLRTPAQQAEFTRLFADFLERGYVAFVGTKANVSSGLRIRYLEETITGESAAVATAMLTRNGSDLDVDYFMIRRSGRWMVRDVVVDGMSLIANYRAQFNRILSTSSHAELVAKMRGDTLDVPRPVVAAAAPAAPVAQVTKVALAPPVTPVPMAAQPAAAVPQPAKPMPPPAVSAPPVPRQEVHVAARHAEAAAPRVDAIRVSAPEPATPVHAAFKSTNRAAASQYWIQVGAFRTEGAAVQLAERLRRQGMTAWHDPPTSAPGHPAGALARVRVGPFATHSDAQSKRRELVARGYAPFIAESRD